MTVDSILVKKSTIKDLIRNLTDIDQKLNVDAPCSADMHRVHCQYILLNLLGEDIESVGSDDVTEDLKYSTLMIESLGLKFDKEEQKVTFKSK